jgi:hypothetical protein
MQAAPQARLADLLRNVDEAEVLRELASSYPKEAVSVAGYSKVLDQLRGLEPASTGMTIVVSLRPPDEDIDHAWWDVSGDDGAVTSWALDFHPWAEWLGMPFRVEGGELSDAQIAARVLWEMTFHGFDNDAVQDAWRKIDAHKVELDEILAGLPEEATDQEIAAALDAAGLHVVGADDA